MAHFLSGVTHERLRERDNMYFTDVKSNLTHRPTSSRNRSQQSEARCSAESDGASNENLDPLVIDNDIEGIKRTSVFNAMIRCCEVALETPNDFIIWTGELDGSICVRTSLTGRPIAAIAKKANGSFVMCMVRSGQRMWVGYSDGCVSVYEIPVVPVGLMSGSHVQCHAGHAYRPVAELKAHLKAVTCLCALYDTVASGGSDWLVCLWDAATLARRPFPRGTLAGHQNGVRCLAVNGAWLLSGGDDGAIRCWDVDRGAERGAPWPIAAHADGVRAIVAHGVCLFSGSMDGTVKVFNAQTTQLIRELLFNTLTSTGFPVTTLAVDLAGSKLWAGNTSGQIAVWSIPSLQHHLDLHEHHDGHVGLIKPVQHITDTKAWSIGRDKHLRVWTNYGEMHAPRAEENNSSQELIEGCRREIIENYKTIENCKEVIYTIQHKHRACKKKTMELYSTHSMNRCFRTHMRHLKWWAADFERGRAIQAAIAYRHKMSNIRLMRRYYNNIKSFHHFTLDKKLKTLRANFLLHERERVLVHKYTFNLQQKTRELRTQKTLAKISQYNYSKHKNTMLMVYLHNYYTVVYVKRTKEIIGKFIGFNQNQQQRITLSGYWHLIQEHKATILQNQKKVQCYKYISSTANCNLLSVYFIKLMHSRIIFKIMRKKRKIAESLYQTYSFDILKRWYSRWKCYPITKTIQSTTKWLNETSEHIVYLKNLYEMTIQNTEESLDEIIKDKQVSYASKISERESLDWISKQTELKKKKLDFMSRLSYSIDYNQPITQQVLEVSSQIHKKSFNLFHDFNSIRKVREEYIEHNDSKTNEFWYKQYARGFRGIKGKIGKIVKLYTKKHRVKIGKFDKESLWAIPPEAQQVITKKHIKGLSSAYAKFLMLFQLAPTTTMPTNNSLNNTANNGLLNELIQKPKVIAQEANSTNAKEVSEDTAVIEKEKLLLNLIKENSRDITIPQASWTKLYSFSNQIIHNSDLLIQIGVLIKRIRLNVDIFTGEPLPPKPKKAKKGKPLEAKAH